MNQYENHKGSGSSHSRARGASRGRMGAQGGKARPTSGGSHSSRNSYSTRNNYSRSAGSGKRRSSSGHGGGSGFDFMKLAVGGVVLIAAIAVIALLVKGMTGKAPKETEADTAASQEAELQRNVKVDGVDITGLSREEAKAAILKSIPWGMTVTWQDQSYQVADLMSGKVDELLEEVYSEKPADVVKVETTAVPEKDSREPDGDGSGGSAQESTEAWEEYSLDTTGLDDAARAEAANVAAQWDKKAKNGSISSYDAASDTFLFTGAENGQAVDQEKLAADILAALAARDFDASVEAVVNPVEPEFNEAAARDKYKTLGSFTTETTANSKRNTNVKLAAQAINGTVLQPGEEFSFNGQVGERTEAKGYKGAAAYNNGEVVEEIGGGVCQVSTTLYNAVLKSGLKTTVRRSHTFEPSYVTPGCDATVSWGGPDYKFVNNSSAAIGLRASYSNQSITVSVYGVPVLEDGVKYSLKSTKLKDMDPPAPTYEEDPTLAPGVEKVKSSGTKGSYWETRLVVTKNGEVVSQDVDHNVTYKGHAPVILRNTSGTMAATQPSETTVAESTTDIMAPSMGESDGVPVTGPNGGPGVTGPGSDTGTSGQGGPGGTVTSPGSGQNQGVTPSPTPSQAPTQAPTQAPAGGPQNEAPGGSASSQPGAGAAPGTPAGDIPQTIAPMPGA